MRYHNFRNQEGRLVKEYEEKQIAEFTDALRKCAFSEWRTITARAKYRRAFQLAIKKAKASPDFQGLFIDVKFPDWRPFLK